MIESMMDKMYTCQMSEKNCNFRFQKKIISKIKFSKSIKNARADSNWSSTVQKHGTLTTKLWRYTTKLVDTNNL